MGQLYSILLIAAGILLAVRFTKESKIFILAGCAFVFAGIWRLVDSQVEADLFAGAYGIVFRIVVISILAVLLVFFGQRYRKEAHTAKKESTEKSGEDI